MVVAVTGAGGFIGSHVVRQLCAQGEEVKALIWRHPPLGEEAAMRSVRVLRGDIRDRRVVETLVQRAGAVVHCAARTSEGAPSQQESYAVNVEATRRLLEVCRQTGCSRFIHLSSQSANEGNPTLYGRTKWLSEKLVRESGLNSTILRPSLVYGPGTRGLFWKTVGLVNSLPVLPIVGSGRLYFRPVYVEDVASAVWGCLRDPATAGKTYELGGAEAVTLNEFVDAVAQALGKKPLKLHLPVWLCALLARTSAWVMKNPPLTLDNVVGLLQMRACDNGLAERDLRYQPLGLQEGLRLSLAPRAPA